MDMQPQYQSSTDANRRDPLTGFYSRRFFCARLDSLLKKTDQPVSATLALLQLENFYQIRRWVGRPEADLLLGDIAAVLKRSLPETVMVCRCEHYEFAALLIDECSVNARLLTDRIKHALFSAVADSIPPQLDLKCAVGLARLDRHARSADVLFATARHRLSAAFAGAEGLEGWQFSYPDEQRIVRMLKLALRENAFALSYQAIVTISGDLCPAFELRCALPTAERKISSAALFEVAVQNALASEIDRWMLQHALETLGQRPDAGLRLTVNLSHNSLVSPEFFAWLRRKLTNQRQLARRLVLQISEIDVLIAQHHMRFVSDQLEQLEITLCIKHFGCTEDPLRYLPLLRAHYVRLDARLTDNISHDPQQRTALAALVTKLRKRGLLVIASRVEDMRAIALLWKAGVNQVQGFSMQAPSPLPNFDFGEQVNLPCGTRWRC